jgi:hypothetical protein
MKLFTILFTISFIISGCATPTETEDNQHFTHRHHVVTWKTADGAIMMKSVSDYDFPNEIVITGNAEVIDR